ncbi:hypothetical protein CAPTEDRAFT_211984 [Capitella teleta]|uniref:Replication protein A OB domain-containing protein n=1 Tax=Capitella teleta TaxID=283909 RepID=R7T7J3_CAPTE|nr:hypothetical protein CAPTEDRAFT_211984 [Capitella teleta]|eukprot:ELT87385.1 hypothetical protein CAPTEDRAFT_211984 [Capitella teleta]
MALITFLILQCFYKKTTVDKVTGMSKEKYVGDVLEKGATRTSMFYVYSMEEGARIAQAAAMTFAVAKNIIRQNRNFCYGPDTKVYLKGMKFTFDQTVVDAFLRPPMCELAAIPSSPRKRVSVRGKVTRVTKVTSTAGGSRQQKIYLQDRSGIAAVLQLWDSQVMPDITVSASLTAYAVVPKGNGAFCLSSTKSMEILMEVEEMVEGIVFAVDDG